MDDTFQRILKLVHAGRVRVSEHGYDELANDDLTAKEVVAGIEDAVVVENYPDYPKGPCVLVLQQDRWGNPVHVVWGIPKGFDGPAVLITAYRPDPKRWDNAFLRRRK